MHKKTAVIGVAAIALAGAAALVYWNGAGRDAGAGFISPDNRDLVARGQALYASHCASCHGARLEGQPNWRHRLPNGRLPAPPHDETGHTWHHPDAVLIDITKNGLVPGRTAPAGYESDMPAFGQVLSDSDIIAVLAYIKSSWPPQALEMQKDMTLQQERK